MFFRWKKINFFFSKYSHYNRKINLVEKNTSPMYLSRCQYYQRKEKEKKFKIYIFNKKQLFWLNRDRCFVVVVVVAAAAVCCYFILIQQQKKFNLAKTKIISQTNGLFIRGNSVSKIVSLTVVKGLCTRKLPQKNARASVTQ